MILATDRVEIFDNTIEDHRTANVSVMSFFATQRPIKNKDYDPYPEAISVHDNRISKGGYKPDGTFATLLLPVLGKEFPDIIYDGILNSNKLVDGQLPDDLRLRVANNGNISFANIHLDKLNPKSLLEGKYQVDRDLEAYAGQHDSLPLVSVPPLPKPHEGERNVAVDVYHQAPKRLSEWGLFANPISHHQPAAGVYRYELNTALFSDETVKMRFIRLPSGEAMKYDANEVVDFPEGTVIAKTFSYRHGELPEFEGPVSSGHPELHLLETRIELRRGDDWYGFAYIWDKDQRDAQIALGGGVIELALQHGDALATTEYHVPNANQCITCHGEDGRYVPLGPTIRNMNRDGLIGNHNQLAHWHGEGVLANVPHTRWDELPKLAAAFESESGSVAERARAYLDVNCAHCHQPHGSASSAGLDLRITQDDPARYGVWKSPVATGRGSGGRRFDIVPGKPQSSILLFRMEATEPAVRMPNLARGLVDHEGLELVREWIAGITDESSVPAAEKVPARPAAGG